MKNNHDEDVEINADAVYVVSVLLAQIVIWLLVSLLIYSEFALWKMSVSQNAFKMIVVAVVIASLTGLSVFLFKRGKKRVSDLGKRDGQ